MPGAPERRAGMPGAGALVALAGGPLPSSGGGGGRPAAAGRPPPHTTLSVADIEGAAPMRMTRQPRSAPQEAAPDPGMQPRRYTHERARGPVDLHLTAPAAIEGAAPGGARADRPRPRAQPLNPLEPAYPWYPERQEAAPVPKFVRDTLDVTDIAGAKAEPAARPPRGLPSTMTADDIEGTRPGWRPHTLFAAQPRDPLCVSDICPGPASRGGRGRGQRGADGVLPLRAASATEAGAGGTAGISAAALPMSARPFQQEEPAVPEYGVAFTVDWHKQRTEAKIRQGEAARQARAAADAAIAAAAAKAAAAARAGGGAGGGSSDGREAAGAVGLAGMMKSLRTFDREGCGRVQAGQLAAALQQSRLGLSAGEVQHLVAAVRDPAGGVDYRPFVSKLWGQLQQQGAVPAAPVACVGQAPPPSGTPAGRSGAHAGTGPAAAAAAAPLHLPQFVVARQRRLQTNAALALAQQPEATGREAAELAALPGHLPWKQPAAAQFGKRMAYDRPAELGTAPGTTFTFADGDPRAAEAALQWKASKAMPFQTAMRRENRPSKQHQPSPLPPARSGPPAASLPATPAEGEIRAVHVQHAAAHVATPEVAGDQAVAAALATAASVPCSAGPRMQQRQVASAGSHLLQAGLGAAASGQRQVASAGGRSAAAARPEANSSPLATGRAAQVAAREEVALLRSLS